MPAASKPPALRRPSLRAALLLATVATAVAGTACGGCGGQTTDVTGEEGRRLEPLPEAPPLDVEPLAVPGAGGALAVVVARPMGAAPGAMAPTITFSKPMIALGGVEEERALPPPATIDPPIPGVWRWLGSASVELIPDGPVPFSTRFHVEVPAGLTAVDGSKLKEAYRWEFTTPGPRVVSIDPAPGDRWLEASTIFSIRFDQPVADPAAHIRVEVEGQGELPLRLVREVEIGKEEQQQMEAAASARDRSILPVPSRDLLYELEARLPLDRGLELVIDGALRGKEGTLTLGDTMRHGYRSHGSMQILGAEGCFWKGERCSWGPLVLATSNVAEMESLRSRLTIEPAVALDWENAFARKPNRWEKRSEAYVVIPGAFRPGTTYALRIAAGVKDEFGGSAPAFEGELRLDDREASLDPGARVALIESGGDGALPVQTVNLRRMDVSLWSLSPSQAAVALRSWNLPSTNPDRRLELDVSSAKNATKWSPVKVGEVFAPGARTGIFAARFESAEKADRYPPEVIGQVTDFAVHSKLGATAGLVWVTRLSTGDSVAGAALSLFDWGGERRWQGRTDAEGMAQIPGLDELIPTDEPGRWSVGRYAMVAAEKDGEIGVTASHWNAGLGPWAFGIGSDWGGKVPDGLGLIFAERGIYRPGDTAHLKGLVRFRRMGEIHTPPKGTKVKVVVSDPKGDELVSRELESSDHGTFFLDVELGREVPLGTFSVEARMEIEGEPLLRFGEFRVEEYRAPQFRVDLSVEPQALIAGEPATGSVLARYLFGGAMAESKVRWSLIRKGGSFTPPGYEAFTFGSNTWWWDDGEPVPSREVIGSGEGLTGPLGELTLDLGTSQAPGEKPYDYTLEAEVADVNRQRVAARTSYVVHPAAAYAGVRTTSPGFPQVGAPMAIELVAVRPDGSRAAGSKIHLEVKRREWKSIQKKGVGGQWFTISEPVEEAVFSCDVVTGDDASSCAFEPAAPGLHVLEAVLVDSAGRRQTTRDSRYVVGSGWVSWQRGDTDRIELVADRQSYEPGETARLLVKSPFPEVDALLTVEREGVISHRKLRLEGNASTLEVPIDESMVPNVFVSVLLSRGRVEADSAEGGEDPGRPSIRLGYAELRVEKRSKRLQVELTPDAAEKRPGDKVRVELQVRDHQGKGAAAEVAVWAVDEGVLRLTGYEIPDPVEAIHPPRGLSVQVGEPLIHLVQRQLYGEKGESAGGGGGDSAGAGFRSDFKTTVLFAPEVRTDAQGRAQVEFSLPDNLTTYRIMAMAITDGDRFGTGQGQIQVSKPLLALPALPRFARVGDEFEAGVVIHANGIERAEVQVKASAEGAVLEGARSTSTLIAKGQPREVRFRFAAKAAGIATLRFSVEGAGERDGVEQEIPIHLPVAMEAVAAYGDTVDERLEAFAPPGGMMPGQGGVELSFSSTILGGFDENMRQLVDYPYGCLEQQASRLVPFVALREMSGRFGTPWQSEAARSWIGDETLATRGSTDPDTVVRETVRAIEKLQNHDGGYRYWSSSGCSAHFASAYAVLSLARAKEVGYPVDAKGFARGQAFLANEVAAGGCERCGWGCEPADDTTRVFALYTLARTGAPLPSYYGELVKARSSLPLFARAMLTDALFVGKGDRRQAQQLLDELLGYAKESAQEVHFEEVDSRQFASLWSSDTRTTALVLQTLATVSPDHPYVAKMGRYLGTVRGRDGRYRNTQEAAFALMALSEVSRTKERVSPDFTASVRLGERELLSTRFLGRSMSMEKAELAVDRLGGGGQLSFRKEGEGVLYYGALLRYAPATMPTKPLDRGITVQRWFEPYTGGGQIRELLAGELVRVKVRIATAQERHFGVISVPLPAGLEAVDTSLASTAALPEPAEDESTGEDEASNPWATRFFSPFHHVERRDDRVVFFADRLPPGIHVTSFIARATTPGDFVLQPAHAEEMYAPEVFGRSDGGRIVVVDRAEVAER